MDLMKEYKRCIGDFKEEEKFTNTEYNIEIDNAEKKIYLKFKGSGPFQDWKQNFEFRKELNFHFIHGKLHKPFKTFFFVHDGIYKKYVSVRNEIHVKIDPFLLQGYKLNIHGFSQGGGIAIIAHEDFWFFMKQNELDIYNLRSYAFAAPMVFSVISSKAFKTRFAGLTVIRNINDIVPRTPGWIFGYRHYGKIITIGKWNWDLLLPWKWKKEHMGYKKLL